MSTIAVNPVPFNEDLRQAANGGAPFDHRHRLQDFGGYDGTVRDRYGLDGARSETLISHR